MYDTLFSPALPAIAPAEVTTQLSKALTLLPELAPPLAWWSQRPSLDEAAPSN